jgi:hypothetical protein
MKKPIFLAVLIICGLSLAAQTKNADVLQNLESKKADNQTVISTATLKSSSRLFGAKDDLTTVILIIPSGSTVKVLDSDSTYLHVTFEDNDGYIFKRQAVIDKTPAVTVPDNQQPDIKATETPKEEVMSRFSYLENKYGTNMAARLNAGKIWKGMNSEMVKDSWGIADRTNRTISGNIIKEEWIYKNTWLYFENNTLVDWGPVQK